jgi:hypothetical protein
MRFEFEGSEVDLRVFPNLVVDKALKHKSKKPLQGAATGRGGFLMGGLF